MKLSILQKVPFLLICFGLLFVNTTAAFICLIVFNLIIVFLEYRQKKIKT